MWKYDTRILKEIWSVPMPNFGDNNTEHKSCQRKYRIMCMKLEYLSKYISASQLRDHSSSVSGNTKIN